MKDALQVVKYELLCLSPGTNYLESKINLSWYSLSKVYLYFDFYFSSPFWRNKNDIAHPLHSKIDFQHKQKDMLPSEMAPPEMFFYISYKLNWS